MTIVVRPRTEIRSSTATIGVYYPYLSMLGSVHPEQSSHFHCRGHSSPRPTRGNVDVSQEREQGRFAAFHLHLVEFHVLLPSFHISIDEISDILAYPQRQTDSSQTLGSFIMKSWAFACLAASSISARVAFSWPYRIFS